MKKNILILSIGFLPNIGGLETHLKDLIDELIKKNWVVTVLTYQPLNTPVLGKWIEKNRNLTIYRMPIFQGIFYKLLKKPILEFLFLEPLLFLITPLILLKHPNIRVINAQGIIAGFSVAFWKNIFRKRYVIAAQSVYHFPKGGIYRQICKWIFKSADKIIAISTQTKKDIGTLGVNINKIIVYTNWENSDFFKPWKKIKAKSKVGFKNKFVVSFFGRLVEEKGIKVLIDSINKINKNVTLAIYGEGPLVDLVEKSAKENDNVIFMKTIPPDKLPLHYSAADLIIMPSLHEEGFGRVAAGALFCSTPVIASKRGALPEIINDKVGKIINPNPKELSQSINFFFTHKDELRKKSLKCREYALSRFSEKNAKPIIESFR